MALSYGYRGPDVFLKAISARLEDSGFHLSDDPSAADFLLIFQHSGQALEELYFGDSGLIQSLEPGTMIVNLSPLPLDLDHDIITLATVSNLAYVEAPVALKELCRKDAFARDNLVCFLAGDEDHLLKAKPLVEALAEEVVELGSLEAAQVMRATHSLQQAASLISAIESEALWRGAARKLGSASSGDSSLAYSNDGVAVLRALRERDFSGDFTIEMLMGDLAAALTSAEDAEVILPQAEAAMHLLELLALVGGVDRSPAALFLAYDAEERAQSGLDWERLTHASGAHHHHDHEDDFDEGDFDEHDFADADFDDDDFDAYDVPDGYVDMDDFEDYIAGEDAYR